jgi:hypothetical protein
VPGQSIQPLERLRPREQEIPSLPNGNWRGILWTNQKGEIISLKNLLKEKRDRLLDMLEAIEGIERYNRKLRIQLGAEF